MIALLCKTRDSGFIYIEQGESFSLAQVVIEVLKKEIVRGGCTTSEGYRFLHYFHAVFPFKEAEIPLGFQALSLFVPPEFSGA